VTQHQGLDAERWCRFELDQQVLMIANEMNRVAGAVESGRLESRRGGYERVLRLTDLTVACNARRTFRRELLRWRDLIAELYVSESAAPDGHRSAFRALLRLRPAAAKQIPLLSATRGGAARGQP
jgi:hypothetical protein